MSYTSVGKQNFELKLLNFTIRRLPVTKTQEIPIIFTVNTDATYSICGYTTIIKQLYHSLASYELIANSISIFKDCGNEN